MILHHVILNVGALGTSFRAGLNVDDGHVWSSAAGTMAVSQLRFLVRETHPRRGALTSVLAIGHGTSPLSYDISSDRQARPRVGHDRRQGIRMFGQILMGYG